MSMYDTYASNASRIHLAKGEALGEGQRRSGEIWGGTVARLGDVIPQQIQDVMRQRADDKKKLQIKSILEESQGDLGAAIPRVMAIDPDLGLDLGKRYNEAQKMAFEYRQQKWTEQQKEHEMVAKLLGSVKDEDSYAQALVTAKMMGVDVSQIPPEYNPQLVDGLRRSLMTAKEQMELDKPPEPKYFNLPQGGKVVDSTGKVIAENPYQITPGQAADDARADAAAAETRRNHLVMENLARQRVAQAGRGGGSAGSTGGLVDAVMANPNIYSTLTPSAKTAIAAELQERGFSGFDQPGAGKPPTGAQNRTLGFFNRARQADEDIKAIEADIAKMSLPAQAWRSVMPNFLQTEKGQLYTQSQRAFTEARLRKDSGAAIPDHEIENDAKTYFVQPGDTPQTIAQKARARAAVLASLAYESGGALRGFYGDEADSILEGYKGVSGSSGAPAAAGSGPKEGETKPIPGHPGTEQTFKNGKWIRTK